MLTLVLYCSLEPDSPRSSATSESWTGDTRDGCALCTVCGVYSACGVCAIRDECTCTVCIYVAVDAPR